MAEVSNSSSTSDNSERDQNEVVPNGNQNGSIHTASQPAAAQRPGGWSMLKGFAIRMFIVYAISSFFRRGNTPTTTTSTPGGGVVLPSSNLYPKEFLMDMYIYVNEEEKHTKFDETPFWMEEELVYGDWTAGPFFDGTFQKTGIIKVPESVQRNGSIYIHVFFVQAGSSPNPKDEKYSRRYTIYKSQQLNKYKKRRFHTTVNLLTGQTNVHPDLIRKPNESSVEIVSHWHPNLTINIIDDHTSWTKGSIPSPIDEYVEFDPITNQYYPMLFFNEYWNMNVDYMPVNTSTPELNLTLTYAPLTLFKWQMYAAQTMRSKWYSVLGDDFIADNDADQDSLKQAFLETSPYLLGITIIVSLVHSVFEFLAFKNDIQFWRNRKSLEGLSVRSVVFGVFQSLIVLLYILDNETNFVVKISVFIGLCIDLWKIHKVINVTIDRENRLFGVLPRVKFSDKSTYVESATKTYDQMAFRYLSILLFPLLAGYMVYSLFYLEHRSWYSWVLNMLYGFLLTFGFIMMTPQLFINYKLKSVAHLPWRMLTYKALNTFIDDLFAFVIKMPTLYRLGCFRDDIIFLIYVYQRYIYKVDPKRTNEFGVSAEDMQQQPNASVPGDDGGSVLTLKAAEEEAPQTRHRHISKPSDLGDEETKDLKSEQDKDK